MDTSGIYQHRPLALRIRDAKRPPNVQGSLHKQKLSLPGQQFPWRSTAPISLPSFFPLFSQCRLPPSPTQQLIPSSALQKNRANGLTYHPKKITYYSEFWPLQTQVLLVSWLAGNSDFCSSCWTLFIGSYSKGPCLNISARRVEFCCQKQQLLKSATYCWVIHKRSSFSPIRKTFVLPKSGLPPAWELTGFHLPLAGGELTPINYVL